MCYVVVAGGYYLHSETSSSYLVSPQLSLAMAANQSYCLAFWYFVYGGAFESTSLSVFVAPDQAYARPEWSRQQMSDGAGWQLAEVSFTLRSSLQVVFLPDFDGVAGAGLALDDVSVLAGNCTAGRYISVG